MPLNHEHVACEAVHPVACALATDRATVRRDPRLRDGLWVMLAGNHDRAQAGSVWERAKRLNLVPQNASSQFGRPVATEYQVASMG
jgi:hypothetical protein